eukprot:14086293-Heterocapsa_arctica.AAC.1
MSINSTVGDPSLPQLLGGGELPICEPSGAGEGEPKLTTPKAASAAPKRPGLREAGVLSGWKRSEMDAGGPSRAWEPKHLSQLLIPRILKI